MIRSRHRRYAVAGLAVLVALGLSGCAESPGTAATVNGTVIHASDVELLTQTSCLAISQQAAGGSVTAQPISSVRQQMLWALIHAELATQFGISRHASYDRAQLRSDLSQTTQLVQAMPAADQQRLTQLLEFLDSSQLRLAALGERRLKALGQTPTPATANGLGENLLKAFQKSATISTDPVFSPGNDGVPGGGSGSLSVPVSSFATGSGGAAKAKWTQALPATQRCG